MDWMGIVVSMKRTEIASFTYGVRGQIMYDTMGIGTMLKE